MAQIEGNPDTYFVIVTRGHRYDTQCLRLALQKTNAYIGMMGSRRRVSLVKEQLREEGFATEELEKVHTPIGLAIGAQTPEEIAVSIMAEIIQEKNRNGSGSTYSKELLSKLSGKEKTEEGIGVLCTIISRKGSAPREIGTKMLIEPDGRIVGTIGGGCAESSVINQGLSMLRTKENKLQMMEVNMTAEEAEEEGMVCGGIIRVMLEML
jgi:xanthine dehydrogenase accessory factor